MRPVIVVVLRCFILAILCCMLLRSLVNNMLLLSSKVCFTRQSQDVYNFEDYFLALHKKMKGKCDATAGNEDAFNTLIKEYQHFQYCVMPLFDYFDVNMLVNLYDNRNTLNMTAISSLLATVCSVQRQAFLCINNLTYTVDMCLNNGERELKNNLVNYAKGWCGFMCQGNGERVLQFLNDGGDCNKRTQLKLISCCNNFNDIVGSDSFLYALGETLCNKLKVERNCIMESLSECNRPAIEQLISDYFNDNATWNAISCNNYYAAY